MSLPVGKPIPAFYKPEGPSTLPTVPIGQTELPVHIDNDFMGQEEIGPSALFTPIRQQSLPAVQKQVRYSSYRASSIPSSIQRIKTPKPRAIPQSGSDSDMIQPNYISSDDDDDKPLGGEVTQSRGNAVFFQPDNRGTNSRRTTTDKPQGEVGRPSRGGYNLQKAMGWDMQKYKKIKRAVRGYLSDLGMNVSKPFSRQSVDNITRIREMAVNNFPDLKNYTDYWPVDDLIRAELKYSGGKARSEEIKKDAKVGRQLRKSTKAKSHTA